MATTPAGFAPKVAHASAAPEDAERKRATKPEASAAPAGPVLHSQPPTPSPTPSVFRPVELPRLPEVPQAFEAQLPQVADDATARLALTPHGARVSLDAGEAGRVSVQVKVAEGVADVRASGPAAPAFEQRQGELRVALAQEGLSLGQFDLAQSNGGRQQREDLPDQADLRPNTPRPSTTTTSTHEDGRLHVQA